MTFCVLSLLLPWLVIYVINLLIQNRKYDYHRSFLTIQNNAYREILDQISTTMGLRKMCQRFASRIDIVTAIASFLCSFLPFPSFLISPPSSLTSILPSFLPPSLPLLYPPFLLMLCI